MDDADLAYEQEKAILSEALSARKPSIKSPDGMCIWCKDEPVVALTAFCSADCGEDYAKHNRGVTQRVSDENS